MLESHWQELVPDEIWTKKHFFTDDVLQELLATIADGTVTELNPDGGIRDKFRKSGVNPTLYSYCVHKTNIRDSEDICSTIMDEISSVTTPFGLSHARKSTYNSLQVFAKSFTTKSFYELHTEPASLYGDFAYLIFLDSMSTGGELIFPSENGAYEHLKKYPEQSEPWHENIRLLENDSEKVRFIGPIAIKPIANFAVLFRVGSAHFVEPTANMTGNFRTTIAGWPYATDTLIKRLNDNCHISEFFDSAPESPNSDTGSLECDLNLSL